MWPKCQAARHPRHCNYFAGATVGMLEVLLRTGTKAAAGGEHNRENDIALIVLNNSTDSGAAAPLALTCAEDA